MFYNFQYKEDRQLRDHGFKPVISTNVGDFGTIPESPFYCKSYFAGFI